jgi:hypothetical protein
MNALQSIQSELRAPKNQTNKFGGYNYRSCEDILEAVKPLLKTYDSVLTISDEIVEVGGRVYVKATARLTEKAGVVTETTAFAREAENKKGMDESQITGAASSYARKYALNGLFCIDDNKDADTGHHDQQPRKPVTENPTTPVKIPLENVLAEMEGAFSLKELGDIFKSRSPMAQACYSKGELDAIIAKKDELKGRLK